MNRRPRRVRLHMRRNGKGLKGQKGQGKGKPPFGFGRYLCAQCLSNEDNPDTAYYGNGKGKGTKKGEVTGRRNPVDQTGAVMKCSICDSEYHLRAQCPQNKGNGKGKGNTTHHHATRHHGMTTHAFLAYAFRSNGRWHASEWKRQLCIRGIYNPHR